MRLMAIPTKPLEAVAMALGLVPALIATLALGACQKKGPCGDQAVVATISGNHGHEISVPPATTGGAYPVKGGSHEHAVVLTQANIEALKNHRDATTRTSSVNAHLHEVTFSCPR